LANPASLLKASPASLTSPGQRLTATFHSPAAIVSNRGRITAPGLPRRRSAIWTIRPFGLWTPLPDSGCRRLGQHQHSRPVTDRSKLQFQAPILLPLPFGIFAPPDHSARQDWHSKSPLLEKPDFLLLPACFAFSRASGSSRQVRYFSSSLLFREPLGTISIMLQKENKVNNNRHLKDCFPMKISPLFSFTYRQTAVN